MSTRVRFDLLKPLARRRRRAKLATLVLSVTIASATAISVARAEIKGDPGLLKTAAARHRANLEKIKTWRGRTTLSRRSFRDDDRTWLTVVSIEFAYDGASGAYRWAMNPEKCVEVIDGKEKPRLKPVYKSGMFRDGAYYLLGFLPGNEKTKRKAEVQADRFARPGYDTGTFDPMLFFTHDGRDIEKYLLMVCENVNHPRAEGSIGREEDRVVLTQIIPPGNVTGVYEMDLSQGGNLMRVDTRIVPEEGPDRWSLWEWSWEEVNGVWVPKRATKEVVSDEDHYVVRLEWEDNEVNERFGKEEFSLAKLGLRRGDIVHDGRTDSSYVIEGAEFPPGPDSREAPLPRSRLPLIIGIIALPALCLLGWLLRRTWTRRTK